MSRKIRGGATLLLLLLLVGFEASAVAQTSARVERLNIATGAPAVIVKGRIIGRQSATYRVAVHRGETLAVRMISTNLSNYFNITGPGADSALFVGSIEGDRFSGVVSATGDYAIDVYLMRSAARRGAVAAYTLTVGVTGKRTALGDVRVPGTPFHVTARIACRPGPELAPSLCDAGVIRRGPGAGTVRITLPGGRQQSLTFEGGRVISASPGRIRAIARDGDRTKITLDTGSRFEIVDAFINGG